MKTPIKPYLDDTDETPVEHKIAPERAPQAIVNPFLDDADALEPRTNHGQSQRPTPPQQRATKGHSNTSKHVSTRSNSASRAPQARKITAPSTQRAPHESPQQAPVETKKSATQEQIEHTKSVARPASRPKFTMDIPALGADESTDVAPKSESKAPYQITKEYRDSLSPEQKEASKRKQAAKQQAKKDAYARGERPWEHKKKHSDDDTSKGTARPTGRKKRDPNKVYHRRDITDRDLTVFYFIAKFRYTTVRIMAKVLGVKDITAHKRLLGLQESGYVAQHRTGLGAIWTLSQRAISALDMSGWDTPVKRAYAFDANSFDYNGMKHTLAIQWVAAQMVSGELENQQFNKFPRNINWSQIIPESMMKADRQVIGGNRALREAKKAAINAVFQGEMTWDEMFQVHPSHWILTGRNFGENRLKVPDMVVSFEHGRTTEAPRSAAIEVELSRKSPDEYRKIFESYKLDQHTFKGVIYVVDNDRTGEVIKQAAIDTKYFTLEVIRLLDDEGQFLHNGLSLVSERHQNKMRQGTKMTPRSDIR